MEARDHGSSTDSSMESHRQGDELENAGFLLLEEVVSQSPVVTPHRLLNELVFLSKDE